MFWRFLPTLLALFVAVWSAVAGSRIGKASQQCYFEKHGFLYTPITSHQWWTMNEAMNTTNETECRRVCCLSSLDCTMYIFSSNSTQLYNTSNCLLLSCDNKSLCLRKLQSENESGVFVSVGIKGTPNISNSSFSGLSEKSTHSSLMSTSQHSLSSSTTTVPKKPPSKSTQKSLSKNIKISNSTQKSQSKKETSVFVSKSLAKLSQSSKSSSTHKKSLNKTTMILKSSSPTSKTSSSLTDKKYLNKTTSSTKKLQSKETSKFVSKGFNITHTTKVSKTTLQQSIMHSIISSSTKKIPSILPNVTHHSSLQESLPNGQFTGNTMARVKISDTSFPLETTSSVGSIKTNNAHTKSPTSSQKSQSPNSSATPVVHTTFKKKFSENHSHTTPASLVISLILGILFFGAVVFLIGRRWSETCLRRGYSRVDYLLNDYE